MQPQRQHDLRRSDALLFLAWTGVTSLACIAWPFLDQGSAQRLGQPNLGEALSSLLGGPMLTFPSGMAIHPIAVALGGSLRGVVVGGAQWLVLRRRLRGAAGWLLATAAAGCAAAFARVLLYDYWLKGNPVGGTQSPGYRVASALTVGAIFGTLQWFVLWRRTARWSGLWPLAAAAGAGVAALAPQWWLGQIITAVFGGGAIALLLPTVPPDAPPRTAPGERLPLPAHNAPAAPHVPWREPLWLFFGLWVVVSTGMAFVWPRFDYALAKACGRDSIGQVLDAALPPVTLQFGARIPLSLPLYAAIVGAFMGAGEWLVLRRRVPRAWGWIPATALAAGVCVFVDSGVASRWPKELHYLNDARTSFTEGPAAGVAVATAAATGLVYGLFTWVVILGKVSFSALWIVATVCATTVPVFCPSWAAPFASAVVSASAMALICRHPHGPSRSAPALADGLIASERLFYAFSLPACAFGVVLVLLLNAPELFFEGAQSNWQSSRGYLPPALAAKAWLVGITIALWLAFLWSGFHAVPRILRRRPSYATGWAFAAAGVVAYAAGHAAARSIVAAAAKSPWSPDFRSELAHMRSLNNAAVVEGTTDFVTACFALLAAGVWLWGFTARRPRVQPRSVAPQPTATPPACITSGAGGGVKVNVLVQSYSAGTAETIERCGQEILDAFHLKYPGALTNRPELYADKQPDGRFCVTMFFHSVPVDRVEVGLEMTAFVRSLFQARGFVTD